jgi:hypothetical protein
LISARRHHLSNPPAAVGATALRCKNIVEFQLLIGSRQREDMVRPHALFEDSISPIAQMAA